MELARNARLQDHDVVISGEVRSLMRTPQGTLGVMRQGLVRGMVAGSEKSLKVPKMGPPRQRCYPGKAQNLTMADDGNGPQKWGTSAEPM